MTENRFLRAASGASAVLSERWRALTIIAGIFWVPASLIIIGAWAKWGDELKALVTEDAVAEFRVEISAVRKDLKDDVTGVADEVHGLTQQVKMNASTLTSIDKAVRRLGMPTEISEYSSASHVAEPCEVGTICQVEIRARRYEATKKCQIVGERSEHTVTSYEDFQPRPIFPDNLNGTFNIPSVFTTIEFGLKMPSQIPPGRVQYDLRVCYQCPWQEDGEPLICQAMDPPLQFTISERQP